MGSAPDVYADLREQLKGTGADVLTPDSEGYVESIKRWSEHCEKRAACVVKVSSPTDVSTVVKFVRANKIPFVVKGGGHSTSGSSAIENGLVIDLSKLRKVTVDPEAKTIKAEGGTIWEDVDIEAAKYGLATVGGTVNHTGVGGLTLGGGYGYLSGKYGLTIDNLVSVDLVLPSSEITTASPTQNPDLFWAIRGAGHNFGVVTSFTFRAFPQTNPVFAGILVFPPDKLPGIVAFLNKFEVENDGNQSILMGFSTAPPPAPTGTPVVLTSVYFNGSEDDGKKFFADLFALEPLMNQTGVMPYAALNGMLNDFNGPEGRKQFGGGAFRLPIEYDFVESVRQDFVKFVAEHEGMHQSLMLWETIPYGKIVETGNDEMAFANRGRHYNVATLFKWYDASIDGEVRAFSSNLLKKASKNSDPVSSNSNGVGVYGNYVEVDVPADAVYGQNAKKLLELKKKYDPDNLFDRGTRLVPRQVVVAN